MLHYLAMAAVIGFFFYFGVLKRLKRNDDELREIQAASRGMHMLIAAGYGLILAGAISLVGLFV